MDINAVVKCCIDAEAKYYVEREKAELDLFDKFLESVKEKVKDLDIKQIADIVKHEDLQGDNVKLAKLIVSQWCGSHLNETGTFPILLMLLADMI